MLYKNLGYLELHTISALRVGGGALEEQCAQVKITVIHHRKISLYYSKPASWEMLAGRLFWFDRSPLIQRIVLVAVTIVFLDAPVWPADSDILPFVLSNASLPCSSAVCASLLSSTSVALAASPLPTLIKRTCFSVHQQKIFLFNSLLALILYYIIFLFNLDSFLCLLM